MQHQQDEAATDQVERHASPAHHGDLPPPPSNAYDGSGIEYTVGKHRVSLPKGKQYTPDVAAAIAKEAFESRANAAVNQIENVLSENDEDDDAAYDSSSEGHSGHYNIGEVASIASSYSVQL